MRNFHFDPFGEPLAKTTPGGFYADAHDRASQPGSKAVLRLGVGLFWCLVVGIVAARVVFFDPDFARTFGAVAANCLHALAG